MQLAMKQEFQQTGLRRINPKLSLPERDLDSFPANDLVTDLVTTLSEKIAGQCDPMRQQLRCNPLTLDSLAKLCEKVRLGARRTKSV
jgi:hypothetical protein